MLYSQKIENPQADRWIVLLHGLGGSMTIFNKQIEALSNKYNLLLIDLHGHGKSQLAYTPKSRDMADICRDISLVMDANGIEEAAFCGISLGTIIITIFATLYPQKVSSIILGGGVLKFNVRTNFLFAVARYVKSFVPYMWLYRFFAWIIMPHKRHEKSRNIFIREAVSLGYHEFSCWVNSLMPCRNLEKQFDALNSLIKKIPVLIVMGDEDHMFLGNSIKTARRMKGACVCIFTECGHVCNIEKAAEFNELVLHFLKDGYLTHLGKVFSHTPHRHTLLVS